MDIVSKRQAIVSLAVAVRAAHTLRVLDDELLETLEAEASGPVAYRDGLSQATVDVLDRAQRAPTGYGRRTWG